QDAEPLVDRRVQMLADHARARQRSHFRDRSAVGVLPGQLDDHGMLTRDRVLQRLPKLNRAQVGRRRWIGMRHAPILPAVVTAFHAGPRVSGRFSVRTATCLVRSPLTSWPGLLSASADVVILVALAALAVSRKVSPLARLVVATFAFACAWLVAAGFEAAQAPGWTMLLGGAVVGVSIVVITATLHVW